MSVISGILAIIVFRVITKWRGEEFDKAIEAVTADGLYEQLLIDFAKNHDRIFYGVVLGDMFAVKGGETTDIMVMPYSRIQALWLHEGYDSDDNKVANIRISSYDKRYQRLSPHVIWNIKLETAKTDYDTLCKFISERNPNVYFGDPESAPMGNI